MIVTLNYQIHFILAVNAYEDNEPNNSERVQESIRAYENNLPFLTEWVSCGCDYTINPRV